MSAEPPGERGAARLLLVVNPAAGGGASTEVVLEAARVLRALGAHVEVEPTSGPGDARRIARARAAAFDRVAACGGDGTVGEVAAGLLEAGAPSPLVVVPAGTANDFAAAVGAGALPGEAVLLALGGTVVPLDVGLAGGMPFVNAASAGVAAELSERARPEVKAALGPLAYLATGIANVGAMRAFEAAIEGADGRFEGEVIFFAVANGQSVGGGSRVAPGARVDDGLLDLVLLPALPAPALLGALRALRTGADHPALVRMRGARFSFEAAGEVAISLDGEPLRARTLDIAVRPAALGLVAHGPAPARTWPPAEKWPRPEDCVDTRGPLP